MSPIVQDAPVRNSSAHAGGASGELESPVSSTGLEISNEFSAPPPNEWNQSNDLFEPGTGSGILASAIESPDNQDVIAEGAMSRLDKRGVVYREIPLSPQEREELERHSSPGQEEKNRAENPASPGPKEQIEKDKVAASPATAAELALERERAEQRAMRRAELHDEARTLLSFGFNNVGIPGMLTALGLSVPLAFGAYHGGSMEMLALGVVGSAAGALAGGTVLGAGAVVAGRVVRNLAVAFWESL